MLSMEMMLHLWVCSLINRIVIVYFLKVCHHFILKLNYKKVTKTFNWAIFWILMNFCSLNTLLRTFCDFWVWHCLPTSWCKVPCKQLDLSHSRTTNSQSWNLYFRSLVSHFWLSHPPTTSRFLTLNLFQPFFTSLRRLFSPFQRVLNNYVVRVNEGGWLCDKRTSRKLWKWELLQIGA